jgi:hypothetical protein
MNNGTGTHDSQQKSVVIFIVVILLLFFASNDKKLNKIFSKNMIQILFLIALIYMHYLKVNVIFIFALFLIFLLFNTDIGKKLQKNRYIKRAIKTIVPYVNPIRFAIEDFIASFTNPGPDDESSIGSSIYKKRVRFDDEGDDEEEYIEGDDQEDGFDLDEDEEMSEMAVENGYDFEPRDQAPKRPAKREKNQGKSSKGSAREVDLLDEIRNDMQMENLNGRPVGMVQKRNDDDNDDDMSEGMGGETPLDQIMDDEDDGSDGMSSYAGSAEAVPDATLDPSQVRELYKEYSSLKREMEEYS